MGRMSAQAWEYKTVKAPMNNPRARQRVLNRYARDGWELAETTRGPLLSAKDHVTLRRAAGHAARAREERAAAQAEKTPEQKRREWVVAGAVVAVVVIVLLLNL
jgi:hypothetical protein